MIANAIGVIIFLAVTVFFGWLVTWAWRAGSAIVKWGGVALSGLLALVFGLVGAVSAIGVYKLYAPRSAPVPQVTAAGTPEQIARGEHLVAVLCAGCHSPDEKLPLSGGARDFGSEVGIPLGTIVPPNLTPGGRLKDWSDGEILRAMRAGVGRDGRPLLLMSTMHFGEMSDEDAQAVVAYLRSQPAVQNQTPEENFTLLTAIFLGAGLFPEGKPPSSEPVVAPPKAASAEYGKYLATIVGCEDCHGKGLAGSEGGFAPPGPNLTALVPNWTQEQFINTIRTGVDPGGHPLDPEQMPWKSIARFDDVELAAIYTYVRGLTPVQK